MSKAQADVGRATWVAVAGILIIVVVAGYLGYTYWSSSQSAQTSEVSPIQAHGKGRETRESEYYQQVLSTYNKKNADKAEAKGSSYVSVLSSRADEVEPAKPQAQVAPTAPPATTAPPQEQSRQSRDTSRSEEATLKLVDEQVKGLLSNWSAQGHSIARVSADGKNLAGALKTAGPVGDTPAHNASTTPQTSPRVVVAGDDLIPSVLEQEIDTDENSVVTAYVPSGPYQGMRVQALGYKRLTNTVDMTFTSMKWKGRTYKISAKAVDQSTLRTSLSGEVNNRWMSRVILPAIANGIGRTGQLYERGSQQLIITPQGGAIQSYPATPDGRAVVGTIVGGMGQRTGEVLASDAANMPVKQVIIPMSTTIGLRFLGPVLSTDELGAEQLAGSPQEPMPHESEAKSPIGGASSQGQERQQSFGTR